MYGTTSRTRLLRVLHDVYDARLYCTMAEPSHHYLWAEYGTDDLTDTSTERFEHEVPSF